MALLEEVAQLIRRESVGRIGFLFGAGASVAAGIPDFRSPGGLYDTLRPELLTASEADRRDMAEEPTTVVLWSLFKVLSPVGWGGARRVTCFIPPRSIFFYSLFLSLSLSFVLL